MEYLLDGGVGQKRPQSFNFPDCQGIDDVSGLLGGNLDQTNLLEIMIKAVCFYVDGEAVGRAHAIQHVLKAFGRGYESIRGRYRCPIVSCRRKIHVHTSG
jgi:hypothetical protein